MKVSIDSEKQRAVKIGMDRRKRLVNGVQVVTITTSDDQIIQFNEYPDGSWDLWRMDKLMGPEEQRKVFAIDSSFNVPVKDFCE